VDYVIPGNDDALRAIRLFASKIADSVVEGAQLMSDKQAAELAAGIASAPAEGVPAAAGAEVAAEGAAEDISMEDVLGDGATRKSRNAESENGDELSVETQTY